jgi:AbrB family looped-hinge helix DNA binding protein
METTRLSTKGQVILPKAIREARAWKPGTEFTVELTDNGILLRPVRPFPPTTFEQVAGCLKWHGKPKTIKQMDDAVAQMVKSRHERGRY